MSKISHVEIVGKSYPLSFSLGASKKFAQKFGSVEKIADAMNIDDGVTDVVIENIVFIAEVLIAQGCAYMNYFEKDLPPYENAPIEDGKYIPLSAEAIEIGLGLMDMGEFVNALMMAINSSYEKEIEVKTEKNAVDLTTEV